MVEHTVKILPHGRIIAVKEGELLLTSLVEHSILLRSDCGGRGVCGKCLVEVVEDQCQTKLREACTLKIEQDLAISVPQESLLSSNIIEKVPATLPASFRSAFDCKAAAPPAYGVAIDLGTTTIALYLCDMSSGSVLSSLSVKNPQALYGDDVVNRIGAVARDADNLQHLHNLVVKTIEWGCRKLVEAHDLLPGVLEKMVAVGNPAMIHIFLGVDPQSIGVAPYQPAFYEARCTDGVKLGFEEIQLKVHTLPQVSGFIGGDILAATVAAELENEPPGTLIIDIGTNGELVYKGRDGLYATSCATGPAFEGASISCGMQAIPGAIEEVVIPGRYSRPQHVVIKKNKNGKAPSPTGLCGSGVISAAAELCRSGVVDSRGGFVKDAAIDALASDPENRKRYIIAEKGEIPEKVEVAISQKDIRSIQLGKAALITGIEFLLKEAGDQLPEKIIIAGAFGSYLQKEDMIALGMIPEIPLQQIQTSGNLAGAGAVMALCDQEYLEKAKDLAAQLQIVDLASTPKFQEVFVEKLSFPKQHQA